MAYHVFENKTEFPIAFLVKNIDKKMIETVYLKDNAFKKEDFITFDLLNGKYNKALPISAQREFLEKEIIPKLKAIKTKIIVLTDGSYFSALTKLSKPTRYIGSVVRSVYEDFYVAYAPSYDGFWYNPDNILAEVSLASTAVYKALAGDFTPLGEGIIHSAEYPQTFDEIKAALAKLHQYPELTLDTETISLKHPTSGLGTICFCHDEHNGIAFGVDYREQGEWLEYPFIREALKQFFREYKGKLIFHNACFDIYILVYQLFMSDLRDFKGMNEGLDILLRDFDDTQIIIYLATNSTLGNKLGLKDNAKPFTGNYALTDIDNIMLYDIPTVLKYNLIDGLATWYVKKKYYPKLVADNQSYIYEKIFKPAVRDFITMQLVGLPVNPNKVLEVEKGLQQEVERIKTTLNDNPIVAEFIIHRKYILAAKRNETLKTFQVTPDEIDTELNMNSAPQIKELVYELMEFPVIETTKSGSPAVGGKVLKKLIHMTEDEQKKDVLNCLIDYSECKVILGTFIPAFKDTYADKDGNHWMFGSLKLGGCVSGRVTASNPNMLALPAGSKYGKNMKACIEAPKGWLYVGSDFSSLMSSDFIQ